MKSRLLGAVCVGLLFGSTFDAQANILVNGGFEDPAFTDNPLHYVHLNGPELPGWTLYSTYKGTVLFNTGYDPVSEGTQAVQIEVPGDWIAQSFATVIGQTYTVSFDLSAFSDYGGPNLGFAPCNPTCNSIVGVTVGPVSGTFSGNSAVYVTNTLQFIADSTVTTLELKNLYEGDGWGNYPHVDNVSVTAVSVPVVIDIKPGSGPNSINLQSRGVIPVAILTTETFDAATVDPASVLFADAAPLRWVMEDVDYDGDVDLIFHFDTQGLNIICGATEATLRGETTDGVEIAGTDSIKTVGCSQ